MPSYLPYYPRPIEFGAEYKLTSEETGVSAVFNNPQHPSYAGMLTEVTGLDSPEIRESAEDLVESDGGAHGRFYYGRRPITMNGKIFGHTTNAERAARSDLIRRASQALRTDGKLSWMPSKRIDNVISNPRFATALTGWSWSTSGGSSATQTRVTGQVAPGTPATTTAVEINFTSAGLDAFTSAIYTPAASVVVPLGGGATASQFVGNVESASAQYIHAQCAVQVVSIGAGAAPKIQLNARAYDINNVQLGVVPMSLTSVGLGGYVTLSSSLPISALPAGTARISMSVSIVGQAATTYVVRLTNMMTGVSWSSQIPSYIDGSKTGGYWHTSADAGPSGDYIPMGLTFRRQQPYRESGGWVKDFQLQLVSADPYILSPYLRATTINIDSPESLNLVSNQGNATYYPSIIITGALNPGATISGTDGEFVFLLALTNATGVTSYTADMLTHETVEYIGTVGDGSKYIDWAQTLTWPSIGPGGGTWGFVNGAGALVSAALTVLERDAWV